MLPADELSPSFLLSLNRRARRLLSTMGITTVPPEQRQYSRSEVRQIERIAQRALDLTRYGACAQLARDMVDISVNVDNTWVEIFPVFELMDKAIQLEHCQLEATRTGYRLLDAQACVIVQGESLRELLLALALLRSDRVTEIYDSEAE